MVINFDANASCSLLPAVREALLSADSPLVSGDACNPSAVHSLGQRAKALIEDAREEVRLLIDAPRDASIIFCSGATEANNQAVTIPFFRTVAAASGLRESSTRDNADAGKQIVTTVVEHPAVLEPIRRLESQGASVAYVPVSVSGEISQEQFINSLGAATRLVSVMRANNETGHCFDVRTLRRFVSERAPRAFMHTDAVQAVGKIPVSFRDLDVDFLSLSGHKLGALPGVGALIVSDRVQACPLILGGAQELRWRGGTENVLGIYSLLIAAREVRTTLALRTRTLREAATILCEAIMAGIGDARLNSPMSEGLPNTLSITFPGIRADDLVVALDLHKICVSSGAACSSGKPEPSHVLTAMGLSEEDARSTIRFSLEPYLSAQVTREAASIVVATVLQMKGVRRA